MGTATITVSSGSMTAIAGVVTTSGAAPPTPEIVPTVTFMNGLSVTGIASETNPQPDYNYIEFFDIFYGSQSLGITGTNLDRVVAIQLDYAGPYKYFGDGDWPLYPEDNAFSYFEYQGVLIVPSRSSSFIEEVGEYYPQLSFTIDDAQHITISSSSFLSMSYNPNTPPPEGYPAFPSPIHGTSFNDDANVIDFIMRQSGGPTSEPSAAYIQDVWWKLRLWYASGSHFIEPEMYIRFTGSLFQAPQFYGWSSWAEPSASVGAYAAGYRFSYSPDGWLADPPNDVIIGVSSSGVPVPITSSLDLSNATSPEGWADIVIEDTYDGGQVWVKSTESLPDLTYQFQDFSVPVTTPPIINKSVSNVGTAWTVSGTNFTQYFGGAEASSFIVAGIYDYPSFENPNTYNATYVSDDVITFTGPDNLLPGNQYALSIFRTDDNADNDPVWWTGWDIGGPISMDVVIDPALRAFYDLNETTGNLYYSSAPLSSAPVLSGTGISGSVPTKYASGVFDTAGQSLKFNGGQASVNAATIFGSSSFDDVGSILNGDFTIEWAMKYPVNDFQYQFPYVMWLIHGNSYLYMNLDDVGANAVRLIDANSSSSVNSLIYSYVQGGWARVAVTRQVNSPAPGQCTYRTYYKTSDASAWSPPSTWQATFTVNPETSFGTRVAIGGPPDAPTFDTPNSNRTYCLSGSAPVDYVRFSSGVLATGSFYTGSA